MQKDISIKFTVVFLVVIRRMGMGEIFISKSYPKKVNKIKPYPATSVRMYICDTDPSPPVTAIHPAYALHGSLITM